MPPPRFPVLSCLPTDEVILRLMGELWRLQERGERLDVQLTLKEEEGAELGQLVADGSADLGALQQERHRLVQAWGHVVASLQHRDSALQATQLQLTGLSHCRSADRSDRGNIHSSGNSWAELQLSDCWCVSCSDVPLPESRGEVSWQTREKWDQSEQAKRVTSYEGPWWLSGYLALFPPRRFGFNPWPGHSGFSHVGIVPNDAIGRRILSGISRFPRPFIPALLHVHLKSPSSVINSRQNLSTLHSTLYDR
ncbi:hypothetical protein PR048_001960 [Dryococelus australis]|uniref:Uncharacterized protein n=1 Tax=Dryococelus australis TaxID=614101 RepID=A0ABQ9IJW9_9NEOP|nr:hypothetical protein PR048_001960 [Dryococelus australis]